MYISSYLISRPDHSPTALTLAAAFGLGLDQARRFPLCDNLRLDLRPGHILFITGPSGSGKSCLLRLFQKCFAPCLDLDRLRLHPRKILPDHFRLPLPDALYFLARAGLADANLFLRTPRQLSDGQLFRFKLALALARKPPVILADRFLDPLDRTTAKILAANVRKFAARFKTIFLLASPHDDFLPQLQPDFYLEKRFAENPVLKKFDSGSV